MGSRNSSKWRLSSRFISQVSLSLSIPGKREGDAQYLTHYILNVLFPMTNHRTVENSFYSVNYKRWKFVDFDRPYLANNFRLCSHSLTTVLGEDQHFLTLQFTICM